MNFAVYLKNDFDKKFKNILNLFSRDILSDVF